MDDNTILEFMMSDSRLKQIFRGVYPSDKVPHILKRGLYIINTEPSFMEGRHWVALSCMDNCSTVDYFDSYGKEPFPELDKHLKKLKIKVRYNACVLQSEQSDVCGDYCILFCYFLSRGHDMEYFISLFSDNTALNDKVVEFNMKE